MASTEKTFWVRSLYGANTREPIVGITMPGGEMVQVRPDDARALAVNLLQAAEAAERERREQAETVVCDECGGIGQIQHSYRHTASGEPRVVESHFDDCERCNGSGRLRSGQPAPTPAQGELAAALDRERRQHEQDIIIASEASLRQGERIIELEDELAQAKARVETLTAALRAITSGHCEDKRLHWLLPYEPVIYCECGWRMEVSLTPEEPRP